MDRSKKWVEVKQVDLNPKVEITYSRPIKAIQFVNPNLNNTIINLTKNKNRQGTLQKNETTFFKLTLPNARNELKVPIWVSGTPEQFLMHIHTAVHACKQMGLEANFKEAELALEQKKLSADIAK